MPSADLLRHLGNLTFDASDEECRCFKVTSAMLG
jgi:hypothetical protein